MHSISEKIVVENIEIWLISDMTVPLETFFRYFSTDFYQTIFLMKERKEKFNDVWLRKIRKCPKRTTPHTQIVFKCWRSHDMWKIQALFVFWRVDLQKIVNNCSNFSCAFLRSCTICILRKFGFVEKISFENQAEMPKSLTSCWRQQCSKVNSQTWKE